MDRDIMESLVGWKEKKDRKPLILLGARQVGKTWILKEFGRKYYSDVLYLSFMNNPVANSIFSSDASLDDVLLKLALYFSRFTISSSSSLLIFDEIQENPVALQMLKAFSELKPEYHIVSAGSYLGMAMHKGISFPVGKVEFLEMYPMTFREFLIATGNGALAFAMRGDPGLLNAFSSKLSILFKTYLFIGGMPEAVGKYVETMDFNEVRHVQDGILRAYEMDFSKHAGTKTAAHMSLVWRMIVPELAKENRRFFMSHLKSGMRSSELEDAMSWLIDRNFVYKVRRVKVPRLPLKMYADEKVFKLYMLDVGLLGAKAGLGSCAYLDENDLLTEFKGMVVESFVLQELKAHGVGGVFYHTNENSTMEIDFLVDDGASVIPVEVKASTNVKIRSLMAYKEKFSPEKMVVVSLRDFSVNDGLYRIPLWALSSFSSIVASSSKATSELPAGAGEDTSF